VVRTSATAVDDISEEPEEELSFFEIADSIGVNLTVDDEGEDESPEDQDSADDLETGACSFSFVWLL
jgi:hypothetical protein